MERFSTTSSLFEVEAREKISRAFQDILEGLQLGYGLDISDINFKDTPKRVAKAYAEIFSGVKDTDKQVEAILSTTFPCEDDNMVVDDDIHVFSMCPHHFLPVIYNVAVGYIPSGQVLGLSKLPRIVEVLAKRPVLQETFTNEITAALLKVPGCQGAAARVRGQHFCMMMRGAKQETAKASTSSMRGAFYEEPSARAEFYSLINKNL